MLWGYKACLVIKGIFCVSKPPRELGAEGVEGFEKQSFSQSVTAPSAAVVA